MKVKKNWGLGEGQGWGGAGAQQVPPLQTPYPLLGRVGNTLTLMVG